LRKVFRLHGRAKWLLNDYYYFTSIKYRDRCRIFAVEASCSATTIHQSDHRSHVKS